MATFNMFFYYIYAKQGYFSKGKAISTISNHILKCVTYFWLSSSDDTYRKEEKKEGETIPVWAWQQYHTPHK